MEKFNIKIVNNDYKCYRMEDYFHIDILVFASYFDGDKKIEPTKKEIGKWLNLLYKHKDKFIISSSEKNNFNAFMNELIYKQIKSYLNLKYYKKNDIWNEYFLNIKSIIIDNKEVFE
jgi:hypothetical protein